MKSVGKPDARNGHVRFDERGRETGRLPVGSNHAPFLDSTGLPGASSIDHSFNEMAIPGKFCNAAGRFLNRKIGASLVKNQDLIGLGVNNGG